MNSEITIVWLRNDLRLDDNPALHYGNEFAKKNNKIIKLDRYDGYIKLIGFSTSSGSQEFDGYCKKFNKIF